MPSSQKAREVVSAPQRNFSRRRSTFADNVDDHPSPGKRQKLKHTATEAQKRTPPPRSSVENMYSFKTDTIDLTSSPSRKSANGSPMRPRRASIGIKAVPSPQSSTGAKKLVVKNFRQTPKNDPDKYLNQVWDQVEAALNIILAQDTTSFSLEELYRGVENVCRQNKAAELAKRLAKKCRSHVEDNIRPSLLGKRAHDNVEVLRFTVDAWTTWRKQTAIIKAIFFFLDRSYLLHAESEVTIDEMGVNLFRDLVLSYPEIESRVIGGTCDLVARDRQKAGSPFEKDLFRDAIGMHHSLAVYTDRVEPKILAQSQQYFIGWVKDAKASTTLPQFLDRSFQLKQREIERCESYGLDDTKRDVVKQIEYFLIENEVDRLTTLSDIKSLIDGNNILTLNQLYDWLHLRRLEEMLSDPISKYTETTTTSIIFHSKKEDEIVPRLLHVKKQLDNLVQRALGGNREIGEGIRMSYKASINKPGDEKDTGESGNDKVGEMIAKYVDIILKGGAKAIPQISGNEETTTGLNEDEMQDDEVDEEWTINRQLDSVLDLFRFLDGKATFEAFYKKDLAKRLLMNRSASADAERGMIDRLRKECGASFTRNLEQMFKDIDRSREDNLSYKTLLEDRETKIIVDLSVNTLSSAAWPSYPDIDVEIPADIQKAASDYEQHYKSKYAGRRLTWKHSLAHCQMRARFPHGHKELVLSSFQAIVLLYFNDRDDKQPATYKELSEATKLPDADLKRTLQSLACARYRVLLKAPKGKEVNESDRFVVNMEFKEPRSRIKINQVQLKETPEEQMQTHARVAVDRQFETQAAIVRIMKGEKKVTHPLLVAKVIDVLKSRGAVNAEDIRTQIVKLIDKDYMNDMGNGTYEYVA